MSDCFSDIEGALVIFDDILISGKTRESHNRCLEEVLKRTKKVGINLNYEKSKFNVKEVRFIGPIPLEQTKNLQIRMDVASEACVAK